MEFPGYISPTTYKGNQETSLIWWYSTGKARKISTAVLGITFHKLQLKGHQWQLALQLFYEAW